MLDIGYMHRKYILFLSLFLFLVNSNSTRAATNYVAPLAVGTGDGLSWQNAGNAYTFVANANPYDQLYFTNGTYTNIFITKNALRLKSWNKWGAKITGATNFHSISGLDANVSNIIDGFWVDKPWLSGVKFNGAYTSVSNCWIDRAGWGSPAAVTNTSGSFNGQGIEMHNVLGSSVTHNLITRNGTKIHFDHGIYINGTNITIAYNVAYSNLCFGIQIYNSPGDNDNVHCYNNLVYGNGDGFGAFGGAIVHYSYGNKKSYFRNNTLQSYRDVAFFHANGGGGKTYWTNNILFGGSGYLNVYGNAAGDCVGGNNWQNQIIALNYVMTNANDTFTLTYSLPIFFPDIAQGRFWLRSSSTALGIGALASNPSQNFWGTPYSRNDVGAFEYNIAWTFDTRNFYTDPNPDYWLRLLLGVPPLPSFPAELDLGVIPSDYYIDCRPSYLPN